MVKRKSTPVKSPAKRQKQDTPRSSRQERPLSTSGSSRRRQSPSMPSSSRRRQSPSIPSSSRRKHETPKKRKRTGTLMMNIGNKPFKIFRTTLKEIVRLQKHTNVLIPKLPFSRLIREIIMEVSNTSHRIQVEALRALQEAAELYLTYLFQDANKCASHAHRVTLKPIDIRLVLELRGCKDAGFNVY